MTIKPDDLHRCMHAYETDVEGASRLYTQETTIIEVTYRQKTERALRDYNAKIRQARESFEKNLKDAGLV